MEKTTDIQAAVGILDAARKRDGRSAFVADDDVIAALHVVGCEIHARPAGAPTIEDIAPHVRNVRRADGRLLVEFDAAAAGQAAAFVAAERMCCTDIVFAMQPGAETVMWIDAPPELIDMVERWVTPGP